MPASESARLALARDGPASTEAVTLARRPPPDLRISASRSPARLPFAWAHRDPAAVRRRFGRRVARAPASEGVVDGVFLPADGGTGGQRRGTSTKRGAVLPGAYLGLAGRARTVGQFEFTK